MKRSIQLLIGLFLLILGGLFFAKYELKKQYTAIDKENPYYSFDQYSNLEFNHLKVEGGNRSHLFVEPSTSNTLYISQDMKENVSYEIKNDTLIITYTDNYTLDPETETNRWGSRHGATVIIQVNTLGSLVANNASIGVDLVKSTIFSTHLNGGSNLELINSDGSLNALFAVANEGSKMKLNERDGNSRLKLLDLSISDNSLVELYDIESDSNHLNLDETSRILAGANFFK